MPPFCPQCGIDNPATARFCDQCGAALVPVAATPATAPTATLPPAAGPIICPQCGTSAIPGEAFCDNCGAPLNAPASAPMPAPNPPYSTNVPAQPVYPPPQPAGAAAPPIFYPSPTPLPAPPPAAPPTLPPRHLPPLPAARVALAPSQLVVGASGVALPLPNSAQAVVGRADAVSKFYPDIDLTPHGALDNGVGRKHLRLFIQAGQIMAEDEDSTNGTLINGQKLAPRQPQPLHDGDQIQLGKLLLRFSEL